MQGMNAHLAVRTGEKMVAMGSQPKEEQAWTPIANSCWRTLGRLRRAYGGWSGSPRTIEEEDLNGIEEAVEVRAALARLQALSVEISEELDAYQQLHAC